MAAQIDQHLQNNARDAIEAIGDGTGLTPTPAFTAALVELVGRVESQRTLHAEAVARGDADATENRLAALHFDESISEAIAIYRHIRAVARLELVDLDPREAAELGPVEVERRQRAFDAAFGKSPSELANLGRVNVRAALQTTVDHLEAGGHLTKARRKHLADAVARVDQAHAAVRDEALDDAGHTDQLVTHRDDLDRQTSALLAVTAALLRAESSPQTLDRLLQASRKRRGAGTAEPVQPTSDADTPAPVPDLPTPEPEPTA